MPPGNKKKLFLGATIIFLLFAFLYVYWVLTTYRNIVHMDIVNIISHNIKHLYEGNLNPIDFVYQPLFPCVVSLTFTFLNAKLFHLNTVLEAIVGMFFLLLLGYKYLREMSVPFVSKIQILVFAFVVGFCLFGFQKWEAALTSFFSFSAFFDLSIIFFSYLFIAKYIAPSYSDKAWKYRMLIFSNVLLIIEATSYYYSYVVSVLILLLLIRKFKLIEFDKKRLNKILLTNTLLLVFAFIVTFSLMHVPGLADHPASKVSITEFVSTFIEKPIWIIKFYLIANTGPFFSDGEWNLDFQALVGLFVLISYGIAIYYFIKKKDKWMLVPVFLILYNIIAYSFITLSRYKWQILQYGASSRYTAFTLSGALGLASILIYYIFNGEKKIFKFVNGLALLLIFACYVNLVQSESGKAPYRTDGYRQIRETLLTGERLENLQSSTESSLTTIEVLKKYKLNVYYNYAPPIIKLDKQDIKFAANTPDFVNMKKSGFSEAPNELTWTNGNASLALDSLIQVSDSMTIHLETYMIPLCKNVIPHISVIDTAKTEHQPVDSSRNEGTFTYNYHFRGPVLIRTINIKSDTVVVPPPDIRKLSFPFLSLELKKPNHSK